MSTPYSRDTYEAFAKMRRYVSVRIKQGVPLVDADLNELDDIRRQELRQFLRWFVGDGVPQNNDGFRIEASGNPNDVIIKGGNGTFEGSGRLLVDGAEVINPADLIFSAQEFADQARADAAGVPKVELPQTPPASRTDLYYLHVWEREISSDEAPDLVDSRIGMETARRIRREWAVRAVDATVGIPPNDTPPGHVYYKLATVIRSSSDIIDSGAIQDERRLGLSLQPRANFDQLMVDTFGSGYRLDEDGQPNLAVSLRDVINAMLSTGQRAPVGPSLALSTEGEHFFPAPCVDDAGAYWLFWVKDASATGGIWFSNSLDGKTWTAPVKHRDTPDPVTALSVTGAPDGSLWLFWFDLGPREVMGQVFRNNVWEAEFQVSAGATLASRVKATANDAGEIMVVWLDGNDMRSVLFSGTPAVAGPVVNLPNDLDLAPALLVNDDGDFLLYGASGTNALIDNPIRLTVWNGATWSASVATGATLYGGNPELGGAVDRFGGAWLFFAKANDKRLWGAYLRDGTTTESTLIEAESEPRYPSAFRDPSGNLDIYFRTQTAPTQTSLYRARLISQV